MRKELEVAIQAAEKAIQMADSREGADEITSKGGIDLVTNTDVRCEDTIRNILSEAFPDYPIVGEERGGSAIEGKPYWLVDPICGTRPYASNVPLYCTNIALVEGKQVTIAAIGMGRCGEIVFAGKGNGAYIRTADGERKISVSDSSNTLWLSGSGEPAANLVRNAMLLRKWFIWQFSSSIAYPYVACGRISGLVHYSTHLSSVHTAAGCFVAAEAGALVTDVEGNPWTLENRDYILAANPGLHSELLALIDATTAENS